MFRFSSKLGWPLVIALCLLPILRWAMILPLADRFASPVVTLLTLGQLAGIIGLTLFAFNLILATRLKVFEDLFGGLNKVFIAHHIIGGVALIALLIHPLMLAMRLVPSGLREAALLLVPQTTNWPVAFGIFALLGLIALMVVTFFVSLPYRVWLITHKFLGGFFFLASLHALLTPNDLSRDLILSFYLLGLSVLGLLAYAYRTLLPNIFIRRFEYTILSALPKADGVVEINLMPVRSALNFKAGQFLFISFRSGGVSHEWHPFTISSPPGNGGVSLTVKSLGGYTKKLIAALPGMTGAPVLLEGAYGRFSYRNFKSPAQIWVAGGIGITPFLSMARALGDGPYQIDLYYSVKSESELIDVAALQAVQIQVPNKWFRVIPFVADKQGFLTAKYIDETSGGVIGKDILLCGPPPMMKALKGQLRAMGVKPTRIHSEEFSMS